MSSFFVDFVFLLSLLCLQRAPPGEPYAILNSFHLCLSTLPFPSSVASFPLSLLQPRLLLGSFNALRPAFCAVPILRAFFFLEAITIPPRLSSETSVCCALWSTLPPLLAVASFLVAGIFFTDLVTKPKPEIKTLIANLWKIGTLIYSSSSNG
ncbi:hypothetical protein PIB30_039289 [Stylosanthes scabra]|uniref:Uncharacterized protein n=1 Tax=Stylosanthes scabra TaxID=79078 RepID=A0ABU6YEY5_9FABA|nr:hypothetical protein [Stylosanthes scabra]